jgi:hypothetical protein
MTTPVPHSFTLYQGTTQREPLERRYVPFEIEGSDCGGWRNACTKEPVQDSDYTDEDYTGCTARMQLRPEAGSSRVLLELTTENGGIELDGKKLTLVFQPADTSPLRFEEGVGQIEVTRPNGDVERQYELVIPFSREETR